MLVFIDERDRLQMNLLSKKVYYKHMPVMYATISVRKELIAIKLNQGFPQQALEKCGKLNIIANYKILD